MRAGAEEPGAYGPPAPSWGRAEPVESSALEVGCDSQEAARGLGIVLEFP